MRDHEVRYCRSYYSREDRRNLDRRGSLSTLLSVSMTQRRTE